MSKVGRRRLGSGLLVALLSVGLAANAQQQQPQLQPKITQAPPSNVATKIMGTVAWISEVKAASSDEGFIVRVTNPTSSTADIGVLYKGKSYPLKLTAGGVTTVTVKDPLQPAMCTEKSFEFQLTGGTNIDTRVRRLKYTGAPTFQVLSNGTGAAWLPGQKNGLVLIESSSVPANGGGYECGKKLRLKVDVENNTNVAATGLKLRMNDVNGDKIGEEPANIPAHSTKTFTVESSSVVSGRTGIGGTITLVDGANEFTAKQLWPNPAKFSVSQNGLGNYAATFE